MGVPRGEIEYYTLLAIAFGGPLILVVWQWVRLRKRVRHPSFRALRAGTVFETMAALAPNLLWAGTIVKVLALIGWIVTAGVYVGPACAFIGLVLLFAVKRFYREPAFWAGWLSFGTVALMISMVGD